MPRAIGANCRLLMLQEDTYGTAPTDDFRRMPFLSCDLGAEQPLLDADVLGVGKAQGSIARGGWPLAQVTGARLS